MYQVLARKYRPKIFDEIIGQDSIIQTLKNAVVNDRVSHAYIFTGTRGVGKTSIARILAKSINCFEGPTINPCGACPACIQIQNGNSVDVLEIDGASNTGVDSIRDLKENILYLPQSLRFKIYIIDEVHMLSNSAFNALLKTLEEPPPHAKFILATTEIHKVPETILSRCQRFNFKRIPTGIILNKLKEIAHIEEISVSGENLAVIASLADGSLRDSLSIFDTAISYFGKDIKEDVSPVLGLTTKPLVFKLVGSAFKKDYEGGIKTIREIYESGADLRQFMKQTALFIRNLLVIKLNYKSLEYDLTEEEINALIPFAKQKSADELLDMMDIIINADAKYQRISSPLLMLELTFFKLFGIPGKKDVRELIGKIDEIATIIKAETGKTYETDGTGGINRADISGKTDEIYETDNRSKLIEKNEQLESTDSSLDHKKIFEHFTKMDEKLDELDKLSKPGAKYSRLENENPEIKSEAENKNFKNNARQNEDSANDNSLKKININIKKESYGIIENIREIFGGDIERIEKN